VSGTRNQDLFSVWFTDSATGYAVGTGGTILKTTDGGTVFIEEPKSPGTAMTLYPNPATKTITITSNSKLSGETLITIFNMKGEQVKVARFQNQNLAEIDVSNLTKGVYIVKIQTRGEVERKKLVIQ